MSSRTSTAELKFVLVSGIIEFVLVLRFDTSSFEYFELYMKCIGTLLVTKVKALSWVMIIFLPTPKKKKKKKNGKNFCLC